MNSIHILISVGLDVKNFFLHGDLEEEVYIRLLHVFQHFTNKGNVCQFKKALHGLKQSPRTWFKRFCNAMLKNRYKQCQANHTLFE